MEALVLILIILLVIFGTGGWFTRRPRGQTVIAPGDPNASVLFSNILLIIAAIVLVVLILRIAGAV